MDSLDCLSLDGCYRRFGVEVELNSTDGRSRPPGDDLPDGIHQVGELVSKTLMSPVEVNKWHHTHQNSIWVIKPDSSCGLEVCSPVSKGNVGIKNICRVVDAIADSKFTADQRCSLHVHVEVADLTQDELAAVLAYWVKCEAVFMDSMPPGRKRNQYCQFIGVSELFEHDSDYAPHQLVGKLSNYKYYSINTYHYNKGRRPTVEFRVTENVACRDSYLLKNWLRLILHFVEMTYKHPYPEKYKEGDQWSSFLWLDPRDVFHLLGFLPGQYHLSPELQETRNWFVTRLLANTLKTGLPGVWTDDARMLAYLEVKGLADALNINKFG